MQDDRLALAITHADGTVTRWGGDEPGAGDVPRALKLGTSIPGGFKGCSTSLARRADVAYKDLALFDDVDVYGPGNETVWEGRQQQFPRQHADDFAIQVGAVGWSAHLEDSASFREIYVDRDISRWQAAPLARRVALAAGGSLQDNITPVSDVGGITWSLPTSVPSTETDELWYLAPGSLKVALLGYKGGRTSFPAGMEAALLWTNTLPDGTGSFVSTALTLDDSVRLATVTAEPALMLRVRNPTTAISPTAGAQQHFSQLAAYGNHGLSLQAISGEPGGVFASDAIADIVKRVAPQLVFTTGAGGTIAPSTFAIPHLVFYDPVTGASAVQLINGYHGNVWAVWEGKTFYWQPADPSTATIWEARLSEGAQIQLEGDQATDIYTGIIVSYTDPTGLTRTVGPPGSATDVQDASLQTTDPTNPAVAAGLGRVYPLTLTVPTTDSGAIQLGAIKLIELNLPQRRGQIIFNGRAHCIQSGTRGVPLSDGPAWRPRAGDYVVIADIEGDQPRQIIETGYDHDPRQNTASIGATPFQVDAIVERLSSLVVGRL